MKKKTYWVIKFVILSEGVELSVQSVSIKQLLITQQNLYIQQSNIYECLYIW